MRVFAGARLLPGAALRVSAARARGKADQWVPPYSLPSSGQVVAIGTNTLESTAPSGWTGAEWNYAYCGAYGGGAFVPTYSQGGAYVMAASGGHGAPSSVDGLLFDFEDATWKHLPNANGVPLKTEGAKQYLDAEGNGSPYHEVLGTQVPIPGHPYCKAVYLPLGSQGSFVYFGRIGLYDHGQAGSAATHRFDLASRTWSRLTADASATRIASFESDSVYDAARNRIWGFPTDIPTYQNQVYLDLSDGTTKTTAGHDWPAAALQGACRTWLHDGLIIRQGTGATLWYFDPDDAATGWVQCNVSGTLPSSALKFERFGSGAYYWIDNTGGNTLTKLTPPANPKTGTWVVGSVTLTGPTMPAFAQTTSHYNRLVYVPAINCLAWLPGGANSVYLMRPE